MEKDQFLQQFRAHLSQTDIDLFDKLGLTTFTELPAANTFDCGVARLEQGIVHILVSSMPAKFWTFTIHRTNAPTVDVMETGSGDLYQFWPFVEAVLDGKFGLRSEPVKPFACGYHTITDESWDVNKDTDQNIYFCNITDLAIAGDVNGTCNTVFKQDQHEGTFDECVKWLEEKAKEE